MAEGHGHPLVLLMARSKSHVVDLILVDYLDDNLVTSCFDAQNIPKWNIFKFEYSKVLHFWPR